MRCNNVCSFKDFDIYIEEGCNRVLAEKDRRLTDVIKIILLGKSLEWSEIQPLRPTDENIKNGYAELTVVINSEKFIIRLDLDYVAKRSNFYVTAKKDNGVPKPMLNTPTKCRIEKNVLDMMILKREDVERLFEKGSVRAEAIISSAAGIDKLGLIKKKAQNVCEIRTRKYGKPLLGEKGVNRQDTLLNKYKLVEMNLERYRDELYASIAAMKIEQSKSIGRMGGLVRKVAESQLNELCQSQKSSEAGAEDLEEVLFALRYPLFFSSQISESVSKLQSALEDMKCPKNSIPAPIMEVFTSGVCICGTEVDEEMKENISKMVEKYSLQHPYYMINEVRNSIDSFCDGTLFNFYMGKTEMEESIKKLTGKRHKPKKSRLLWATTMPEITITAHMIMDLKMQIENLKSDMLYLTDIRYNDDPQSNIQACRMKIRGTTLIMKNADIVREYISKTETFTKMMDEIFLHTSRRVKDKLLSQTNTRLSALSRNAFFIEDINGCLIFSEKGHGRDMKYVSGVIFIDTILKNMDLDLPVIVTGGPNEMKHILMLEPAFQQMVVINNQPEGESVAV